MNEQWAGPISTSPDMMSAVYEYTPARQPTDADLGGWFSLEGLVVLESISALHQLGPGQVSRRLGISQTHNLGYRPLNGSQEAQLM